MKTLLSGRQAAVALLFLTTVCLLGATAPEVATAEPAAPSWHARTLGQAIGYMLLFTAVGVAAAIGGYKLFDLCTPGEMHKEIVENKNIAAAIIGAAVILGVCIIVAAAMLG